MKEGDIYNSFVSIVKKYMTKKNCKEFVESLDNLFPNKTPEIVGVLLGKLFWYYIVIIRSIK